MNNVYKQIYQNYIPHEFSKTNNNTTILYPGTQSSCFSIESAIMTYHTVFFCFCFGMGGGFSVNIRYGIILCNAAFSISSQAMNNHGWNSKQTAKNVRYIYEHKYWIYIVDNQHQPKYEINQLNTFPTRTISYLFKNLQSKRCTNKNLINEIDKSNSTNHMINNKCMNLYIQHIWIRIQRVL